MTPTVTQMIYILGMFCTVMIVFILFALYIVRQNAKKHWTYCCMATCYYWHNDEHIADGTCKTNPMIDNSQRCVSYMSARCARSNSSTTDCGHTGKPVLNPEVELSKRWTLDPDPQNKKGLKRPFGTPWSRRSNKKVH